MEAVPRTLGRALFAAALLFCAPAAVSAGSPEAVARAMPSIVSVLPEWQGRPADEAEPEGSGVAIGDGRTIVTASHVLGDAVTIRVRSHDGRLFRAERVAADVATDIAVLRIGEALPALAFGGDPDPADPVCTIGNAFGLDLSVTCGVVSATRRANAGFNAIEDFVQTDAAVNPGASGGALIDADGQLVGILSAIFTKESDANIGVNFAVSAVLTARVVAAIEEAGGFMPPTAGVRLQVAPPEIDGEGPRLLVRQVRDNRPGARSGLKAGDRILAVAGHPVRAPRDFVAALARHDAAVPLEIEIERDGSRQTLDLVFE